MGAIRVTSTSWRRRSAWVPKRPPKPEPMTTTLWGVLTTGATRGSARYASFRATWSGSPCRLGRFARGSPGADEAAPACGGWLEDHPHLAGGHHVPLAGVLRLTRAARGPAVQARALPDRAEQALPVGATATNGDGFGVGWYGDSAPPDCSAAPARLERPATCVSCAPMPRPAGLRPHPRLHRVAGAADQLPPVPPRGLAVDAQRVRQGLPRDEARPRHGGRPDLFADILGTTDSEMLFFLALSFGLATTRAPPWPARSGWSSRRPQPLRRTSRCR